MLIPNSALFEKFKVRAIVGIAAEGDMNNVQVRLARGCQDCDSLVHRQNLHAHNRPSNFRAALAPQYYIGNLDIHTRCSRTHLVRSCGRGVADCRIADLRYHEHEHARKRRG